LLTAPLCTEHTATGIKAEEREDLPMTIFIPTPLRVYAAGKDSLEVGAETVADALGKLTEMHPELRKHLFTAEGKMRSFVNVYLNDEDVRYLPEKDSTKVHAADTLTIIPSIAGG
jgi:molybdopterin converting factor small subunit